MTADARTRAEADVRLARGALDAVQARHARGQLGAADVDRAEARLDAAIDRLDAAAGLSGPAGDDLDGMDALEAAYHEGAT